MKQIQLIVRLINKSENRAHFPIYVIYLIRLLLSFLGDFHQVQFFRKKFIHYFNN